MYQTFIFKLQHQSRYLSTVMMTVMVVLMVGL